MYLGRLLPLQSLHDVELAHRLKRAWAKFMSYKKELCGKCYRLRDRLKLLNATVTPTVWYACGTRTTTEERERKLRTTQRKMLRWIVGVGRRTQKTDSQSGQKDEEEQSDEEEHPEPEECAHSPEKEDEEKQEGESWVDWIRRSTHIATYHLQKLNIDDWVTKSRALKWSWAGHVARRRDGRWSTAILLWEPPVGKRRVGRPVARWRDDLDAYAAEHWHLGENE